MSWDINVVAGLVAGVVAMAPGAIIYSPGVLGNAWMKEIKHKPGEGGSPRAAVAKMFVTSLINGLMASLVVWSAGAHTFGDAFLLSLVAVGWFWISSSLMLVFFENRSWKWFQISALSHVTTAAVIGVVLGLFVK
jgi:hypothetical protein